MASRGISETSKLQENLEDQLERLMNQLNDLEESRADLDDDEYEETKKDTLEQLDEFSKSLDKMKTGNITLIDNLNAMQLAIQAAISQAFKTPEVIRLFAKKQPDQLRIKLSQLERDHKVNKLSTTELVERKLEILMALRKLGETLSPSENEFMQANATDSLKEFEKVNSGSQIDSKAISAAASEIKSIIH